MTYFQAPALVVAATMVIMIAAGCVACVLCAPAAIAAAGKDDPGEVVVDEFAGQALTFLVVPLAAPRSLLGWESLLLTVFGFYVFRVADIVKPWPIKKLERLPRGWGILADDLAAGVGAAVLVYIGMRLLVRA